MSTKKFWYRVEVGDDYWFFNSQDDTLVHHSDDLFETSGEANECAVSSLEDETAELERKKALLDARIKNTILKLKGILKD